MRKTISKSFVKDVTTMVSYFRCLNMKSVARRLIFHGYVREGIKMVLSLRGDVGSTVKLLRSSNRRDKIKRLQINRGMARLGRGEPQHGACPSGGLPRLGAPLAKVAPQGGNCLSLNFFRASPLLRNVSSYVLHSNCISKVE